MLFFRVLLVWLREAGQHSANRANCIVCLQCGRVQSVECLFQRNVHEQSNGEAKLACPTSIVTEDCESASEQCGQASAQLQYRSFHCRPAWKRQFHERNVHYLCAIRLRLSTHSIQPVLVCQRITNVHSDVVQREWMGPIQPPSARRVPERQGFGRVEHRARSSWYWENLELIYFSLHPPLS